MTWTVAGPAMTTLLIVSGTVEAPLTIAADRTVVAEPPFGVTEIVARIGPAVWGKFRIRRKWLAGTSGSETLGPVGITWLGKSTAKVKGTQMQKKMAMSADFIFGRRLTRRWFGINPSFNRTKFPHVPAASEQLFRLQRHRGRDRAHRVNVWRNRR